MEKESWQVCELEDNSEFSVAAVAETWIVKLDNGSLMCFWPTVSPGLKIRTLKLPKDAGKDSNYKCRILMDGGM